MDKVGILLPAYNEEKNIQIVIREAKKYLPGSKILVVDDGSTDRTGELAERAGIIVLRHKVNKGKGEALKTGFKYFLNCPDVNIVVIADTDRQYPIKDSVKLIKPLEEKEADFVTGYRKLKSIPFANRLGNFGWKILFNFFFRTNLKDTNCGFVALTKNTMRKIKNVHGGYIIENSMFIDAIKNDLRIKQVPVSVTYGKRDIPKFARMFFGILIFIVTEGLKYRLSKI